MLDFLEVNTMKCPRCIEPELVTKNIETLEIDECPECGGVWLDQGELEEAKDLVAPDLRWWDFEIWKHQPITRFMIQCIKLANTSR